MPPAALGGPYETRVNKRHARQQDVFDIRAKLARSLATCFPNRVVTGRV
jgi:hypothetical protein